MRATWITTWPVASTVRDDRGEVVEPKPLRSRRAYLPTLEAGKAYSCRIAFRPTGGYCTAKDTWTLKRLGPPVRLAAGEHRLRMTNLGDGLAMDYLAAARGDASGRAVAV